MRQDPISTEKKSLSGNDMKAILRICGYKLTAFAEDLDKSYVWTRTVLAGYKEIPLKYYDKLVDFVSEDNFNLAIEKILEKRKAWNDRRTVKN